MKDMLSSFDSTNYFQPTRAMEPIVDYRGGLVRELQRKMEEFVGDLTVFVSNLSYPQQSLLSGGTLVEAYQAQFDTIERYRSAPSNWSSGPVSAPTEEQVRVARRALLQLFFAKVPAPKVMLLDEGVIGAYWRRGNNYASIDFDADGEFPWAIVNGDDIESGIWMGDLPPPIQLRAVVGA
jgi:hypothetical protein